MTKLFLALLLVTAGCTGDDDDDDMSMPDASGQADSGHHDAGHDADAGADDATVTPDGSEDDAGEKDAEVDGSTDADAMTGAMCDGFAGIACPDGQFCKHESGMCLVADGGGRCQPMPEGCGDSYAPVCSCDGRTFANECEANVAGANIDHDGECTGGGDDLCGGVECEHGEYCDRAVGMCGSEDGTCEPIPTACGEIFSPVCGCDGTTYPNECEASVARVSVRSRGECGSDVPEECRAQRAFGVGDCDAVIGVFWSGSSCAALSGCSCEGADCHLGYATTEACVEAHTTCEGGTGGCAAQDARGEGMCAAAFGPFWNGRSCQYMSGCSCVGADCDDGYESIEACQAAHEECVSDCRSTGCDEGEVCMPCWVEYSCVPEGAVC